MKKLAVIFWMVATPAFAATGDWFLDPHFAVGHNPAQGTHFRLGADLGMYFTENITGGVGAYWAAGEEPSHDRELGVGPFVGYVYPITRFLMLSAREEINYIDQRNPVKVYAANGTRTITHTNETGVASVTTAAAHIFFTPNFVLSGGYRFVLGLTNEALDDDRSGAFVGLAFGI